MFAHTWVIRPSLVVAEHVPLGSMSSGVNFTSVLIFTVSIAVVSDLNILVAAVSSAKNSTSTLTTTWQVDSAKSTYALDQSNSYA